MLIIFYFLLFLNSLAVFECQISPCPSLFRYEFDNIMGKKYGKIIIPNPPKNVDILLRVNFSIPTTLPTEHSGNIEWIGDKFDEKNLIGFISSGKPLLYKVDFPLQYPLPLVTEIFVNNRQYCVGQQANGSEVTSFFLEHILHLSRVDPRCNPELKSPEDDDKPQEPSNADEDLETLLFLHKQFPKTPSYSTPTPQPPIVNTSPVNSPFNSTQLNSDQHKNCGKSSGVDHSMPNKLEISPGQWPWLVAIFVTRINFEFQCSGNLITDRNILTAAQCMFSDGYKIPPKFLKVSLGRHRLNDWNERGAVTREVREYFIHPEYTNRNSAHGDLAILVLKESVQMSWRIRPVCLWSGAADLEKIVWRIGYSVGWGKDENGDQEQSEPRKAQVVIISQEQCLRGNLKTIRSGPFTSNKTFCAGLRKGTGPCGGDSGSGLMIHDETTNTYYLRGILSYPLLDGHTRYCDLSSYIVYADVAKSSYWIHARTSDRIIFPERESLYQ